MCVRIKKVEGNKAGAAEKRETRVHTDAADCMPLVRLTRVGVYRDSSVEFMYIGAEILFHLKCEMSAKYTMNAQESAPLQKPG